MSERKTIWNAQGHLSSLGVFISERERDIKGLLLLLANLGVSESEAWSRARELLAASSAEANKSTAAASIPVSPVAIPTLGVGGGAPVIMGGGMPMGNTGISGVAPMAAGMPMTGPPQMSLGVSCSPSATVGAGAAPEPESPSPSAKDSKAEE